MSIYAIVANRACNKAVDTMSVSDKPVVSFAIDRPADEPIAYEVLDELAVQVLHTMRRFNVHSSAALACNAAHACADRLNARNGHTRYVVRAIWG